MDAKTGSKDWYVIGLDHWMVMQTKDKEALRGWRQSDKLSQSR